MSDNEKLIQKLQDSGRKVGKAKGRNADLGKFLQLLPGIWENHGKFKGRGWNLIALPFGEQRPIPHHNFRVLLNQYNETLTFRTVDTGIPNRGILVNDGVVQKNDQTINAIDYEQHIKQIHSGDEPITSDQGQGKKFDIHHEPGLFMHMLNKTEDDINIARLSTIPHGDSVLALGRGKIVSNPMDFDDIDFPEIGASGLPIGVPRNATNYLAPYFKFTGKDKFMGIFDATEPFELLRLGVDLQNVEKTTILHFDTQISTGGIGNIPFVTKQANATDMVSTFWIHEMKDKSLVLQYSQLVFLDFFDRTDGKPGLIRWPHVSINTMVRTSVFDRVLGKFISILPGSGN